MVLEDKQCLSVRAAMEADSNFLTDHRMIDYSLLLLSARPNQRNANMAELLSTKTFPFPTCSVREPFCMRSTNNLYTFSIIDYLNNFNGYKQIESAMRHDKFIGYGHQLTRYVRKICPTRKEYELQWYFREKVHKKYGLSQKSIQEAWAKLDKKLDNKVSMSGFFHQSLGFKIEESIIIRNLEFGESDMASEHEFKALLLDCQQSTVR